MRPIITHTCQSPLGPLTMASDGDSLLGLWMEGQLHWAGRHFEELLRSRVEDCAVFARTREWLDVYFKGQEPSFTPPLNLIGSEFQKQVWEILLTIPYGKVITYNDIALQIAHSMGKDRMSAQAVGGAVGHNPISIIVPCHRVVGTGGNLTGYAGGVDKKIHLLRIEKTSMSGLSWKEPPRSICDIRIQEASIEDMEEMLKVQRQAFLPSCIRLDWMQARELTETLDMARKRFQDDLSLKMTDEKGRMIGFVSGAVQDGSLTIDRLMVLPLHQRKGYGTLLLRALQERLPNRRCRICILEQQPWNVRLLRKEGFRTLRREQLNDHISILFMEKDTILAQGI